MNSNVMKGMLLMLTVVYIVSPVDACPGPVDDILVALLGLAARKKISNTHKR